MNEKMLYVELPKGARFQRVSVMDDGRIGIAYTDEADIPKNDIVENNFIPKPEPLVGGGEVYRKEGSLYWYCKVKMNDVFMHFYTRDLTEDDLMYDLKGKKRNFKTSKQKSFRDNVLEALANKPQKGFCWISAYEPSLDAVDGLKIVENKAPFTGWGCETWKKSIMDYLPRNESKMCSKTTYFLLLLRWLKDGIATFEEIVVDSSEIGHYSNTTGASDYGKERTGKREFGGVYGLIGNTIKIVEDELSKTGFSRVGGSYINEGKLWPAAQTKPVKSDNNHCSQFGVGIIELQK